LTQSLILKNVWKWRPKIGYSVNNKQFKDELLSKEENESSFWLGRP